ncbi:hypothetical protein, partial [Chloroflexus aurantiacus]|uniref:hypothetical protein n=1 Tax=Chloroflexus aurantiacus TaxID=1108 RepID=UPI002352830A
ARKRRTNQAPWKVAHPGRGALQPASGSGGRERDAVIGPREGQTAPGNACSAVPDADETSLWVIPVGGADAGNDLLVARR